MGDDYICFNLCAGNSNAHLMFTLSHLDEQQTSFWSLSALINNGRQ